MAAPEYNIVKILDSKIEYSPADRNLDYVKNIVHQRENPDPFIAYGFVFGILVIMYVIYIIFIKKNISGIWFGKIGDAAATVKYKIVHNPFTDSLTVKISGGNTIANGKLIGHTIYLHGLTGSEIIGVIIGYRNIVWINSEDVWHRVKNLI